MKIDVEINGAGLTEEQKLNISYVVENRIARILANYKKPISNLRVPLFIDSILKTYSGSALDENDDEVMKINGSWAQSEGRCTVKLI